MNKENIDSEHQAIKKEIASLHNKILGLQRQGDYYNAIAMRIASLRASKKDVAKDMKGIVDKEITELETKFSTLKTPLEAEKEIENVNKEINQLQIKYWQTPFHIEPLYLKTKKTFVNTLRGIEIRPLADGTDRLFLYNNSQEATPNCTVILDEKTKVPIRIERYVQNSETNGERTKFVQKVIVDKKEEPQEPKKVTPKQEVVIGPIKVWECKCGYSNYFEKLQCGICNAERPVDWELKKK